jgi:type VI secretion system secreted protein VgrG
MEFLRSTNLVSMLLFVAALAFLATGVRALRLGRRTIYFQHRRQRVLAGWWLSGSALLLFALAALTFRPGNPLLALPVLHPAKNTPTFASPPTVTISPTARIRVTPTVSATSATTALPVIPLSIEAQALSSVTPGPNAVITEIKFSTEMDGVLAFNPSVAWRNPISRMYAVFVYREMTPGAQWTVLWFRNGSLVYFETHPWKGDVNGRGFSFWEPLPFEFLPGHYEVQMFVGSQWKATAGFDLTGDPHQRTPTLTPRPTRIPSQTPTLSRTPSEMPSPTRTPSITPTFTLTPSITPRPSRTLTPTFTPRSTNTPSFTPPPTATFTFTPTITLTPTRPPTFTPTTTRTPTRTFTPSVTPLPSRTPLPTHTPLWSKITIYFADSERLANGLTPFEVGVVRYAPSSGDLISAALTEYFKGPGDVEKHDGLVVVLNGFTGFSRVQNDSGLLRVYLTGACQPASGPYSIAQALVATLKQFPEVKYVKIYDANGQTHNPIGASDSAPACLGDASLLLSTSTPTSS